MTTLEETERTARRVFGGAHPLARSIEGDLRRARAAIRAREQPLSPPSLVISVANLQCDDVYFKVKPTMRLQKIFDAYANRKGVAGDSLRFLFKGSRVDGEPTCADIGLEDGDQLDVENAQDAAAAREE